LDSKKRRSFITLLFAAGDLRRAVVLVTIALKFLSFEFFLLGSVVPIFTDHVFFVETLHATSLRIYHLSIFCTSADGTKVVG